MDATSGVSSCAAQQFTSKKVSPHLEDVFTLHRFVRVPAGVSTSWKYVRVSTLKICPCPTALSVCLRVCPTGVLDIVHRMLLCQPPRWVTSTCSYQTVSPACHWVLNGDQHKTDMKPQVTDNLSLTKAFAEDIYDILEIQNLLILCCVFFFVLFFINYEYQKVNHNL